MPKRYEHIQVRKPKILSVSGGAVKIKIPLRSGKNDLYLTSKQIKKVEQAHGSGKKHVLITLKRPQVNYHLKNIEGGSIFDSIGNFFTRTIPNVARKVKEGVEQVGRAVKENPGFVEKGFDKAMDIGEKIPILKEFAGPIKDIKKEIRGKGVNENVKRTIKRVI
jgi:hypothetical protein